MLLNEDIVDIEKPDAICSLTDGICSLIFVLNEFPGCFYIHLSFLLYIQDLHK